VREPRRDAGARTGDKLRRGTIIIEMHDAHVRVLVEAGVDRATLCTVLELVGKGGGR